MLKGWKKCSVQKLGKMCAIGQAILLSDIIVLNFIECLAVTCQTVCYEKGLRQLILLVNGDFTQFPE